MILHYHIKITKLRLGDTIFGGLVVRTKQPNGEGLLLVGAGVQLKGEAVDVVGVIRDLLHQTVDGNFCFQRIQRAVRQVQAVNGEAPCGFSGHEEQTLPLIEQVRREDHFSVLLVENGQFPGKIVEAHQFPLQNAVHFLGVADPVQRVLAVNQIAVVV